MLGVVGATVTWGGTVAGATAPWGADPASHGYIGLCNERGQQITRGNVNTAPFAWRAVSSAAATGAYAGPSRTSVLLAFQPIDSLAPNDWSGDSLTASSRYSNPASPMAAATANDESLQQYMVEFKPKWDGYLQLRMYLGADNEQPYSVSYPTLDIRVKGDTWRAVDGGPVDCAGGKAVSIETLLLPASSPSHAPGAGTSTPASPSAGTGTPAGAGTASTGSATHPSAVVPHPSNAPASAATATARTSAPAGSSSDSTWIAVGAALVLVSLGLVFGLYLPRARRRRALEDGAVPVARPDSPPLATATKGTER